MVARQIILPSERERGHTLALLLLAEVSEVPRARNNYIITGKEFPRFLKDHVLGFLICHA